MITSNILETSIHAAANKKSRPAAADAELDRLSALSYPIEMVEEEGQFTASHPDLPGCVSFGDTPDEAVAELRVVRRLWIQGQLESGNQVPEPLSYEEKFSGKFVLRVPKSLHRALHDEAKQQNVSLNQYLIYTLMNRRGRAAPEINYEKIAAIALSMVGVVNSGQKDAYMSNRTSSQFFYAGPVNVFRHLRHFPKPKNLIRQDRPHLTFADKQKYLEVHSG